MQQNESPTLRAIVPLGGGHSHVVVLRQFAMRPIPGVRLTPNFNAGFLETSGGFSQERQFSRVGPLSASVTSTRRQP